MSGGCWRHRTGEGIGVVGLYSPSQFQLQMTTFIIHTTSFLSGWNGLAFAIFTVMNWIPGSIGPMSTFLSMQNVSLFPYHPYLVVLGHRDPHPFPQEIYWTSAAHSVLQLQLASPSRVVQSPQYKASFEKKEEWQKNSFLVRQKSLPFCFADTGQKKLSCRTCVASRSV